MKKHTIFLTVASLFLLLTFSLNAQSLQEEERAMSQGMQNALVLEVPNATVKVAEKVWKKYVKEFKGKTKKDRKTDEWFSDDAKITAINGSNTLDVYTQFSGVGDVLQMTTWFDLGGAYLSSFDHESGYNGAYDLMLNFAKELNKEMTLIELENEEKELKALDNNLKKLARAKESYEREIENAKERIRQAESNIENNLIEQSNTLEAIDNQKVVIEQVKVKLTGFDN